MKKIVILALLCLMSAPTYAVKGESTFSFSNDFPKDNTDTKSEVPVPIGMQRAPANENFYIDPDKVDVNDPVAVEIEKQRIRENLTFKRQDDWNFRRNRGAR